MTGLVDGSDMHTPQRGSAATDACESRGVAAPILRTGVVQPRDRPLKITPRRRLVARAELRGGVDRRPRQEAGEHRPAPEPPLRLRNPIVLAPPRVLVALELRRRGARDRQL